MEQEEPGWLDTEIQRPHTGEGAVGLSQAEHPGAHTRRPQNRKYSQSSQREDLHSTSLGPAQTKETALGWERGGAQSCQTGLLGPNLDSRKCKFQSLAGGAVQRKVAMVGQQILLWETGGLQGNEDPGYFLGASG